jgi:hypothetical protein
MWRRGGEGMMHGTKRTAWAAKLLLVPLAAFAQPASAEVVTKSENGFVVRLAAEVTALPAEAWRTLITPAQWWSSQHTFSGEAANLTFDPVVGGCFCELLPRPDDAPAGQRLGGVQHMRVVYIEPPRAMRLVGALGPLQSEALSATMTMTVKPTATPAGKGSRILFEYVVGGFMRYKVDEIAPAVDRMLAAQLLSLAGKLGPVAEPAEAAAPAGPPAPDAELAPVEPPAKGVVPLRGVKTYSLPPSRRAGTAPAPQRSAAKPPEETASLVSPAAALPAAITPALSAKVPAKPAVKSTVKAAVPVRPKTPVKAPAKAAPKAPNPDDAAHLDANAAFDALLGAAPAP